MIKKFLRRTFVLSVLASAALSASAQTSGYPTRPVKMIVAFAAGGPIDLAARVMAEHLAQRLGQPFVVENRTGANGAIAAEVVRTSPG